MITYSVKKLSKLAGVSIRTLHIYDEMGLLKPLHRTAAGYRMYGEKELLRLQQILFYRELDFSLQQIGNIIDNPAFNVISALEEHKLALISKKQRIGTLLNTLDNTIHHLKEKNMLNHEELYQGFPKEKAEVYRHEAGEKWGTDAVEKSEQKLMKMGKDGFKELIRESKEIAAKLVSLMKEDHESTKVQYFIGLHYQNIRKFWGTENSSDPQAEAYAGLGDLYVSDGRYTLNDGVENPEYAMFLSKAMRYFAEVNLGLSQ